MKKPFEVDFSPPAKYLQNRVWKELSVYPVVALQPPTQRDTVMVIGITNIAPIVALIAGIAILLVPRLLNFIVAAYLIIVGVLGLGLIH